MVSVSRKGLTRRISGTYVLLLVCAIASAGQLQATPMLYGSSGDGSLFTINLITGTGTLVGPLPVLPTEIEADNRTGRAYVQQIPNGLTISEFNINTGEAIGAPVT
ncbi:MAG TPA: hypothetical protein VM120_29445, partial [Bryobacteraceae bacterium]|nr:hypothetical protein [Bryobacteraceae bacterium]